MRISLFLIIFFLPALLFAQSQTENDVNFSAKFEEGNQLLEEKMFNKAIEVWKQLVEEKPENANVNYKLGFAYLNSRAEKEKALPHLKVAADDITDRYDIFSHREEQAPPKARYYYARALHLNQELDSAIANFEQFRESVKKRHFLHEDAQRQIEMCKVAKEQLSNPRNIQITNMGETINSEYPDYSPVLSADEQVLYFTSRRPATETPILDRKDGLPFETIFVSYKNRAGQWEEPEKLDLGFTGHHATISVSADGQELFIFKDDDGDGNIYKSVLDGESWGEPVKMGSDINTESWETHGVLSADGRTFYFVSDREGGIGGRDIYRCKMLPTGEWSKAQNLGKPINTPYDEDAPFIHPDNNELYFSSNGHKSMGGFDIFFSEKKPDGNRSEPTNIGYPINSVDNDVFFVTSTDGKRGYYSSIKENTVGEKDLYSISLADTAVSQELAVLKGFVSVEEGENIPPTQIWVTDLETGDRKQYKPRDRDGGFVAILPPCKDYKVEYAVKEKTIHQEEISIPCNTAYQEIQKEIFLKPLHLDSSKVVTVGEGKGRDHKELKWKVKIDGKIYEGQGSIVKYVTEDGTVLYSDNVEEGVFKYRHLSSSKEILMEIESGDPHLCDQMEMMLVDAEGNIVQKTVRGENCSFEYITLDDVPGYDMDGEVAEETLPDKEEEGEETSPTTSKGSISGKGDLQRFYQYNEKGLDPSSSDVQELVEKIASLVSKNDQATVIIEASASKVPTQTFKNNKVLSAKRASDAENDLEGTLKNKGVDISKVKVKKSASVLGPPYEQGNIATKDEYRKYQYVKISAK